MLYGGVSLAIYMNGVVQELFRLVRATAPTYPYEDDPWTQPVYFPSAEAEGLPKPLRGSELVYRKLAQALPLRDSPPVKADQIADEAPVRTRFVVDILSGSSAGGINGIFLAKALANQQDIKGLRDLWVDEGDIAILLNDKRSYESVPSGVERQDPPRSLLNGQRLYTKALARLQAMADTTESWEQKTSPSYVEQLDLWVTTTDLQGLLVPIALQDRTVYEKRHRHVFHFVHAIPEASGSYTNDFEQPNDGILAFAARATSSFPFAFEPVTLEDTTQVDETFDDERFGEWGKFFDAYQRRGAKYPRYAFADGGYLDNKPFTHATKTLRRRRSADLPVDRKLVYVEPDPGGSTTTPGEPELPAHVPRPRPDVLANVVAAAHALPRSEPIRDDVQEVLDRNVAIEQLLELTLKVEADFIEDRPMPFELLRELPPDADDEAVDQKLGACAVFHRAYRDLRGQTVGAELASMIAAVRGLREDSDVYRAVALVIRVWVEERHARDLNAFLFDFDFGYRVRRLKFLQDRLNDLLRSDERSHAMRRFQAEVLAPTLARGEAVDIRPDHPETQREILRLKLELNKAFVELRRRARAVRQNAPGRGEADQIAAIRAAVDAVAAKREGSPDLSDLLAVPGGERGERAQHRRANALAYMAARAEPLGRLEVELRNYLRATFATLEERTLEALVGAGGRNGVGVLILGYYGRFDSFDAIALPLQHPDLGETNPVDVLRISPQDATSIVDERALGVRKLAGNAYGHFGGFLDKNWRRNDILWGRLDGAERILAAVLPPGPLLEDLRTKAQAAILREELLTEYVEGLTDLLTGALLRPDATGGPFTASAVESLMTGSRADRTALLVALRRLRDEVLVDHLKETYLPPAQPKADEMLRVAGRAVDITGKVLEETSERRGVPSSPWFWASRIGRLAWGVGEVAMPRPRRSIPGVVFRHWSSLAILLAVVLILAGVVGVEGAQKVGWVLLGAVVGIRALVWVAEALAVPPQRRPLGTARPPARPAAGTASRTLRALGRVALLVAALGGAVVVVAAFGFDDQVSKAGWWAVAAGLATALSAYFLRVAIASRHRALALVLAGVAALVLVLASVEVARHGDDDIAVLAELLPGNRSKGFEESARSVAGEAWRRLWPW